MRQSIFVLCDPDELYLMRMSDYLLTKVQIPYELHCFTDINKCQVFLQSNDIKILLASESAFRQFKEKLADTINQIFVLVESEMFQEASVNCISKYQKPEDIVKAMLEEIENPFEWNLHSETDFVKMIGIYSPIKRCLQTPFALTMGQILAKDRKVLYLNFECYSGIRQLMNRDFSTDMMDVMYYFRCAKDKLAIKLSTITQQINGLYFIPPVYSSVDLKEISGEQWISFCKEIAEIGKYEYLILDLDESMNGLFELLKCCKRIYTITKDDRFAKAKLAQYEQILEFHELEEIAKKTIKCQFPVFSNIPEDLEMMTHGELANYTRAIVQEDLYAQQ